MNTILLLFVTSGKVTIFMEKFKCGSEPAIDRQLALKDAIELLSGKWKIVILGNNTQGVVKGTTTIRRKSVDYQDSE